MFSTLLESVPANDEKTEIMPLGDNILQEKDFPTHSIGEVIKILGIYLGYVGHSIYDLRKMSKMFKEIIGRLLKSLENNPRQTSVPSRRTFCIALQLSNF